MARLHSVQRQRSKNDLAGMVEGDAVEALAAAPADDLPTGWPGISERRMSLTRSDVLQLIYPYNQTGLGVHEGSSRSSSISASSGLGEEVMDAVMRELGSKVSALNTAVSNFSLTAVYGMNVVVICAQVIIHATAAR